MIQARMNRLFNKSGRCFDVAVDHGMFNEPSFLTGIEEIGAVVSKLVAAAPDAIQLTPGMAPLLQSIPGRDKPALVLRTDIANVYGNKLPKVIYSKMVQDAVGQAVRLDAACVVVNLLLLPDQPDLHGQCIDNVSRLKPVCQQQGMPLMVEPLVMQSNSKSGGYMVDGNFDKIITLVRQAAELGADVIKADPCDDVSKYHRIVKAAGKPVLVRGGGRVADDELLKRTYALIQEGVAGIVYGRNVIQHPKPEKMVRALMAVVHEGCKPDKALKMLKG